MKNDFKEYGLIGKKLSHSFSANFFNNKFLSEKINANYTLFPLERIGDLKELIESKPSLIGLNVTIPYKISVMDYLDSISKEAQECGAVNVIKISRKGASVALKGYNTDVIGFRETIRGQLKPIHKRALIFGTGGASGAISTALRQLNIDYTLVSRSGKNETLKYSDINKKIIDNHQILVNATPLGTFPDIDEAIDIPYELLTDKHLAYDLVYNPSETLFLKNCRAHGVKGINGLPMLIRQAEESWKIWNHE